MREGGLELLLQWTSRPLFQLFGNYRLIVSKIEYGLNIWIVGCSKKKVLKNILNSPSVISSAVWLQHGPKYSDYFAGRTACSKGHLYSVNISQCKVVRKVLSESPISWSLAMVTWHFQPARWVRETAVWKSSQPINECFCNSVAKSCPSYVQQQEHYGL